MRNTQINRAIRSSGIVDQSWSAGTWLIMILGVAFPPLGLLLVIVALCSGRKTHTTAHESFKLGLEQPSRAVEVSAAQRETENEARRVRNAEIAREAALLGDQGGRGRSMTRETTLLECCCGKQNRPDSKFCYSCGSPLQAQVEHSEDGAFTRFALWLNWKRALLSLLGLGFVLNIITLSAKRSGPVPQVQVRRSATIGDMAQTTRKTFVARDMAAYEELVQTLAVKDTYGEIQMTADRRIILAEPHLRVLVIGSDTLGFGRQVMLKVRILGEPNIGDVGFVPDDAIEPVSADPISTR